ncbi:hypothetical protein [Streptomyces syringium]|uniref:hypothetical protein n=1 Tax=Streptomyces syringium TaxID=76729 RepID=UPI0033C2401F
MRSTPYKITELGTSGADSNLRHAHIVPLGAFRSTRSSGPQPSHPEQNGVLGHGRRKPVRNDLKGCLALFGVSEKNRLDPTESNLTAQYVAHACALRALVHRNLPAGHGMREVMLAGLRTVSAQVPADLAPTLAV